MSISYKVLGQANPAATTVTTLYTSAGTVIISSLVISIISINIGSSRFRGQVGHSL